MFELNPKTFILSLTHPSMALILLIYWSNRSRWELIQLLN